MQLHLLAPDRSLRRMLAAFLFILGSAPCQGGRFNSHARHASLRAVHLDYADNSTRSNPFEEARAFEGSCGVPEKVTSKSNQEAFCPDACPYRMEDRSGPNADFCTFHCVADCSQPQMNKLADVPDKEDLWCRPCRVEGCSQCMMDGTDTCSKCREGYDLKGGQCVSQFWTVWYIVFGLVGTVVLVVGLWLADIALRPVTNQDTCDKALKHRWTSRITPPKSVMPESSQNRHHARMWPLSTNLRTTDVAGPGVMMLMNFELMVLVWAVVVLLGWIIVSLAVDKAMLYYGTLHASTPRMYCILLLYGSEMKWSTLHVKVGFIAVAYVGTTLLCFAYSVYQCRLFRQLNNEETTQSDFALLCNGLPRVKGAEPVEDKWRAELSRALNSDLSKAHQPVEVIGVSVCWNTEEQQEMLTQAYDMKIEMMESDHEERQAKRLSSFQSMVAAPKRPWRKFTIPLERAILGIEDPSEEVHQSAEDMRTVLNELETTGNAFVVFASEAERDEAVQRGKDGIQIGEGNTVTFEELEAEPDTVEWDSFAAHNRHGTVVNFGIGMTQIAVALAVWTVFFYIPYAYFLLSASYENGQEQNMVEAIITCFFLVGGNLVMYQVCDVVSRGVGYRFSDERQSIYVFYYFTAVMFNVLVDLGITYYLSFRLMAGRGVYTSNGTPLAELPTFYDRVVAYPLQRELGAQLKAYAFPATFLVGFIVEPIAVYYAPYWLCRRLISIHDEIGAVTAMKALECPELDLGRYADLILNMTLACFVFFVPGGWTLILFGGLVVSHIYLYMYDSYRVLRLSKCGDFASIGPETMVQNMLCIPCAILLQTLIFKSDCMEGLPCSQSGAGLTARVVAATTIHVALYFGVVTYVIPILVTMGKKHVRAEESFADCATRVPATWFSTNLVHCLRSEYIYKHSPPCSYFVPGHEKRMERNVQANAYYSEVEKNRLEKRRSSASPPANLAALGQADVRTP